MYEQNYDRINYLSSTRLEDILIWPILRKSKVNYLVVLYYNSASYLAFGLYCRPHPFRELDQLIFLSWYITSDSEVSRVSLDSPRI